MKISDTVSSVLDQKESALSNVSPETTVYNAIKEMADRDVGALLVMVKGQLVGLVSERDTRSNTTSRAPIRFEPSPAIVNRSEARLASLEIQKSSQMSQVFRQQGCPASCTLNPASWSEASPR